MRHQWLTPTILGCVATLAIAVSGCGEGTAEIVEGDETIVENVGTQQHGHVEYIESTDALLQRMDMTRIVTFEPDTPFTAVLLNVAARAETSSVPAEAPDSKSSSCDIPSTGSAPCQINSSLRENT